MIAFIEGRLLFKSPESIIVSAQGLGYQIAVPLSSFYDLPDIDQSVRLHIYTHVRQDAIQLFGFLTPREKEIFLLLIGVSGIGPKVALNILSGISSEELSAALLAQDSGRVQRIPGIGKKTSERIVLELKDKIKKLGPVTQMPLSQKTEESQWEDALSALINLGYPRAVAEKALSQIPRDTDVVITLEDLLRKVLKLLSR
ncbi:MAG TPA: Holliday junction branch migration protein RuvA [Thermodesulfobacteriota bacterium]|nr:Holliday junction branch migration protein RuvA [Thermodesulfobacteriota bacterium]